MLQLRPLWTGAARLVPLSAAACLTIGGSAAHAQQIEGAATQEVATFVVRGVDSAFDPNTNSYMVVGAQGLVIGVCLNGSGMPISGAITINSDNFGAFPRVAYSPHVMGGGFLVTWAEEIGSPSEIHARTVSCSGVMGAEQVISGGHTAWIESGPAVAYSTTSQRFLVAWKSFPMPGIPVRVKATLVDTNGARVSDVVDISPGFGRDPGVAWNPNTNQFGVSFSGENGDGSVGYSGFAVVPATNPAAFARTTFNSIAGGLVTISDLSFNTATNRYVMTWFEFSSGALAKIAEFDAAGNLISQGLASSRLGSYDALSIAYNRVSGTFLLGGIDRSNDAMLGLELNSRGFPFNGENTLSATHRPSFYERVAASTLSKTWNGTFSARRFSGIGSVIVTSFSSGGGPPGSFTDGAPPPPPPDSPPPPPPPTGCTTIQPGPGWRCVDGGWLPPLDSPTPPPPPSSSCTTPQPGPGWVCVNGNWLPPTTTPPPSTGSCTTPSPGPGWVCVNGNWLPPDLAPPPPPPASSCTTPMPGPGWVCVGGGWLPPDLAPPPPPPSSSCTTPMPGPGWVCVGGGWLPPDLAPPPPPAPSTCTTIQPGPDWVCVNGNWLPPGSGSGAIGGCVGSAPVAGWVCINGNWLPPDHPLVIGGAP